MLILVFFIHLFYFGNFLFEKEILRIILENLNRSREIKNSIVERSNNLIHSQTLKFNLNSFIHLIHSVISIHHFPKNFQIFIETEITKILYNHMLALSQLLRFGKIIRKYALSIAN